MESLILNANYVHQAIKGTIKTSFININLKSKYYNRKDNYSMELVIGCVRSSVKDTKFRDGEVKEVINSVSMALKSFSLLHHEVKGLTDKRTKKNFEMLICYFKPEINESIY